MLMKRLKTISMLTLILCLLAVFPVGSWLASGPVWAIVSEWKGLNEPLPVGSIAPEDTPVAHSIQDMETTECFVLCLPEYQEEDEQEGVVYLSGVCYWLYQLDSGEIVAYRYNTDIETDQYRPWEGVFWCSPVGTWRPWALSDQDRAILAREAPQLTTTDYYVDMEATKWTLMTQEDFVRQYGIYCYMGLFVVMVALWALGKKLTWIQAEDTKPKNDLELWLTGTYAIWGQFYTILAMGLPYAKTHTIHIGGCPRVVGAKRMIKETLKSSWDITDYNGILETVEYMSRGPGLLNCVDQGGQAWELCRSMQLLGCAYLAGWCNRKELLRRSCEVGVIMQRYFHSWEELCQGFLDGYSAWRLSDGRNANALASVQQRADIYWDLHARPNGPYHLPWNMKLSLEQKDPEYSA